MRRGDFCLLDSFSASLFKRMFPKKEKLIEVKDVCVTTGEVSGAGGRRR